MADSTTATTENLGALLLLPLSLQPSPMINEAISTLIVIEFGDSDGVLKEICPPYLVGQCLESFNSVVKMREAF